MQHRRDAHEPIPLWQFLLILIVALLVAIIVGFICRIISHSFNVQHVEGTAWLLILLSQCGWIVGELVFSPRDPTIPWYLRWIPSRTTRTWSSLCLYADVLCHIFGLIIGIFLITQLSSFFVVVLVSVIICFHFVFRHYTSERFGTPHLSHRAVITLCVADTKQRELQIAKERDWGLVGDALQIATLVLIAVLTDHVLWIYGVFLLLSYIFAVQTYHQEVDESSSYLMTLFTLAVLAIIIYPTFLQIKVILRLDIIYMVILGSSIAIATGAKTSTLRKRSKLFVRWVSFLLIPLCISGILTAPNSHICIDLDFLLSPISRKNTGHVLLLIISLTLSMQTLLAVYWSTLFSQNDDHDQAIRNENAMMDLRPRNS